MKLRDIATETFGALMVNRVRSGLTVLGIVIGIASVISMVAIGQGAQSSIQANIESIGSNLLTVSPGAQRGVGSQVSGGSGSAQSLTIKDADAIAQLSGALSVAPNVSGRRQIVGKGTNTNASVVGTTASYASIHSVEMEQGSFITEQNNSQMSKVVVLGSAVRDSLFGTGAEPVGQKVRINNISFTVIGVTLSKGGSGFGSIDENAFVPVSTAQQFLSGQNASLSSIDVQAQDANSTTALQNDITTLMLERHRITDSTLADFNVRNMADIAATASSVTGTFTLLLGAVAAISLVVGGIGIMNMMLTTVTERTREIGLRKAIGAKTRDIRIQFLVEAALLTLVGGIVGVVLGFGIAILVSKVIGIAATVTLMPVVLAFGVSAAIGIVFGFYPAYKASKLRPIEALRYE